MGSYDGSNSYWQQPEKNSIPETQIITYTGDFNKAKIGLAIEGSDSSWTGKEKVNFALPTFDYYSNKPHYIDLFNKTKGSFTYQIKAPAYVISSEPNGAINSEKRIFLTIDWAKTPKGISQTKIVVSGNDGSKMLIPLTLNNSRFEDQKMNAFLPQAGYISMEAQNYTKAFGSRPIFWKTIPNYGKTLGGVAPVPVTAPIQKLDASTPHLEYDIYLNESGTFKLNTFISPTIDFTNSDGLKFAVSVDEEAPIIVNISTDYITENAWRQSVADNIKIFKTPLKFYKPGKHTIKYWMVNPGVVLQKLVLDLGGLKPSFLGPTETFVSEIKQP